MYIPPVALWDHYKTSRNRETICRECVGTGMTESHTAPYYRFSAHLLLIGASGTENSASYTEKGAIWDAH